MSQLTFDGFVEANGPESTTPTTALPETPRQDVARADSWYKGRVLSHSSISMYRTCPQRWKFRYIDKVPEKPRPQFSFGKSVHSGLEFLFAQLGQPWPSLEDLLTHYRENWIHAGYESAVQEKWFFQEGERILKGFYAKHQKDALNALQVEYKFTIDIDGVPVMGYIDRVDKTPRGGLSVIDYKTGKAFDKSRVRADPQLTLYQIACRQALQAPVESVTLYHLNSLTPLTMPAHSNLQETEYRAVVVESAKGIMDQKFDPKPAERGHCLWCDYMQVCPAFAGKKAALMNPNGAPALSELADRYGKLQERMQTLREESTQVGNELLTRLRVAGQTEVQGQHYRIKRQTPVGEAETLEVEPNSPQPNA